MRAETWGTPTPVLILVSHNDPFPIPTLIASAPFSHKYRTASPVATFPAITSTRGMSFLIFSIDSPTLW